MGYTGDQWLADARAVPDPNAATEEAARARVRQMAADIARGEAAAVAEAPRAQQQTALTEPGAAYQTHRGRSGAVEQAGSSADGSVAEARDTAGNPVGRVVVPANLNPTQAMVYLQNQGFSQRAAMEWVRSQMPTTAPRPAGRQPGTVTESFSMNLDAGVTPENQANLTAANEEFYKSRSNAQLGERQFAQLAANAEQELANEHARQVQLMEQREAERQQDIGSRMQAFDESIRRVADQRIDPEGFFGGDFGRRLGAGIVVALGQLGAAMGGGENAALGIINGAIERNIAAQRDNLQNQREGVRMEGQALSQYQRLLGDERAAEEAARAAHYAAVLGRVRTMMANAKPEQLAGLQRLANAIAEQQAAAQAAAADRGRWSIERNYQLERRTDARGVQNAMMGARQSALSQMEQLMQQQAAAAQGLTGDAVRRRGAGGGRRAGGQPGAPAGAPDGQRDPSAWTSEAINEALTGAAEQAGAMNAVTGPDLGYNGMFEQFDPNRWNADGVTDTMRNNAATAAETAASMNDIIGDMLALRRGRSFGDAMADRDTNTRLRADAHELVSLYLQSRGFGAPQEAEFERLAEIIGNGDESGLRDWMSRENTDVRLERLRQNTIRIAHRRLNQVGWRRRDLGGDIEQRGGNPGPPPTQNPREVEQRGVEPNTVGATVGAVRGATVGMAAGAPFGGPIGSFGGMLLGGALGAGYGGEAAENATNALQRLWAARNGGE